MKNQSMQAALVQHDAMSCDWQELSKQLLSQWHDITREELENTHHKRRKIAKLLERKEGIPSPLAENYLWNLERTLPLFH